MPSIQSLPSVAAARAQALAAGFVFVQRIGFAEVFVHNSAGPLELALVKGSGDGQRLAEQTGFLSVAAPSQTDLPRPAVLACRRAVRDAQAGLAEFRTKAVGYAYPSSPSADRLGFGDGCYIVQTLDYDKGIRQPPVAVAGFEREEDAFDLADALPYAWDRVTRIRPTNVFPLDPQ